MLQTLQLGEMEMFDNEFDDRHKEERAANTQDTTQRG